MRRIQQVIGITAHHHLMQIYIRLTANSFKQAYNLNSNFSYFYGNFIYFCTKLTK